MNFKFKFEIENQFKPHFIPVFLFQTYFQSISVLLPILKM